MFLEREQASRAKLGVETKNEGVKRLMREALQQSSDLTPRDTDVWEKVQDMWASAVLALT